MILARGIAEDESNFGVLMHRVEATRLLSAAEEVELAKRIERGDPHAKRRMIESNIRLVFAVAWSYRGRGVPLADLAQEGTIGLARAVEGFDYRRGCRLPAVDVRDLVDSALAARRGCQRSVDPYPRQGRSAAGCRPAGGSRPRAWGPAVGNG